MMFKKEKVTKLSFNSILCSVVKLPENSIKLSELLIENESGSKGKVTLC